MKFWRELWGISRVLSFSNFYCWLWHLVFNLTAFWAKPWMTYIFDPTFCVYTFKYWYRKITEQRQNFANSDRNTNEDAEIILIGHRPRFCISSAWDGRCSKEDVLRRGSVRGTSVRTGAIVNTTERWSIAAGQSRVSTWDGWKAVGDTDICVDFKTSDFKWHVHSANWPYHCNWFE